MGCVCLQKRLRNIRDTVCCACCTYSSPTFAAQRQPLASFAVCLCGCQEVAELHSGQLGSATATKHSLLTSLPTLRLSLSWFQRAAGLICEGSAESGQNKLQRESQQQAKSASKPHRPNRKQLHAFKQPETPKKHRPNQTPGLWGEVTADTVQRVSENSCNALYFSPAPAPFNPLSHLPTMGGSY